MCTPKLVKRLRIWVIASHRCSSIPLGMAHRIQGDRFRALIELTLPWGLSRFSRSSSSLKQSKRDLRVSFHQRVSCMAKSNSQRLHRFTKDQLRKTRKETNRLGLAWSRSRAIGRDRWVRRSRSGPLLTKHLTHLIRLLVMVMAKSPIVEASKI